MQKELAVAEREGKRIFPVLLAGDEGTAVPFSLATTQFVDARRNLRAAVEQELLPALRRYLGSPKPVPPPPMPAGGMNWRPLLWDLLAIGVVVLLILGYALRDYFLPAAPTATPDTATTIPIVGTTPPTATPIAMAKPIVDRVGVVPDDPDDKNPVKFAVEASGAIDHLDILVDGESIHTCPRSTCVVEAGPFAVGDHAFEVVAYDPAGRTFSTGIGWFKVRAREDGGTAPVPGASHSTPEPASPPASEPTASPAAFCRPGHTIVAPADGQELYRGYVPIDGEVVAELDEGYRLHMAPAALAASPDAYSPIVDSSLPKASGTLGVWDTRPAEPGAYVVRLSSLAALADDDCRVTVTLAGSPQAAGEPTCVPTSGDLPPGPTTIRPAPGEVIPSSAAGIAFAWSDSGIPSNLLYDLRIFRKQPGGTGEGDILMEWRLPTPTKYVPLASLLHPAPDLQARLEELGFSNPYGEYRWRVRVADVEAPLIHRHDKTLGPESTFVLAP